MLGPGASGTHTTTPSSTSPGARCVHVCEPQAWHSTGMRRPCETAATRLAAHCIGGPVCFNLKPGVRNKTRISISQDDTRIVTASGDMTLALWDTNTAQRLATFAGHKASVKSVSPWPACHDVLASGGRDGRICLFDGRSAGTYNYREGRRTLQGLTHAPVMQTQVLRTAYWAPRLFDHDLNTHRS